MNTLTEEQVALLDELLDLDNIDDEEEITDEECEVLYRSHYRVTCASSGGLYPNCSVTGGSCSGC